jgi:PAS domain S-box-containing protein
MKTAIVGCDINTELDVLLAHKRTVQLSEFLGISVSDQTKMATAISEVCRNCLEYACDGKVVHEIVEKDKKMYLQATIRDKGPGIPQEKIQQVAESINKPASGRGHGLTHAKKLTDYLEIESGKIGTEIRLGIMVPNRRFMLSAEKIQEWKEHFKNEPPISPYDELRRRNIQLLDLTEELLQKNKELESAKEKVAASEVSFEFISRNVPDMIFKADYHGALVFINSHWHIYTGIPNEELMEWGWLCVVHPDDMNQVLTSWREAVAAGNSYSAEFRLRKNDGQYYWHSLRAEANSEDADGMTSWVGTISDIDVRVRSSHELENVVLERTQELQAANVELKRSNTDLEQFAYIASHDLNEPIRMVSNFTNLLAHKYEEKLDDDAREYIAFISEGAARMQNLVADLLNYSRIGRRDTDVNIVDANEVLDTVKGFLEEKLEIAGAVIKKTNLPRVKVMGSSLHQVLQNLVENAIKFRGSELPVIKISAERKKDFWQFRVKDNGIGMNPAYIDKIFIIFQRLHTREKYAGTGIGLAICKKIVEANGGEIWVDTQLGSGSTFYFTFPAVEEDPGGGAE